MATVDARLSSQPLDIAAAIAAVGDPTSGGTAVFVGTVRASSSGPHEDRSVESLEYEALPELAEPRLRSIAESACERFGTGRVVAIHRTGLCELGEPTVVVACSAPHRAAALDACRWMIDRIKTQVPIWKKEVFADGSAWVEQEAHG